MYKIVSFKYLALRGPLLNFKSIVCRTAPYWNFNQRTKLSQIITLFIIVWLGSFSMLQVMKASLIKVGAFRKKGAFENFYPELEHIFKSGLGVWAAKCHYKSLVISDFDI